MRHRGRLQQLGTLPLDHYIGDRVAALLIPLQAEMLRGVEPPADPLHRYRQGQRLGDR